MRLLLKASLLLLLTVTTQFVLNKGSVSDAFDEAHFTVRVYVANLSGLPDNDTTLLDAAAQLMRRAEARGRRENPRAWTHEEATVRLNHVIGVG